VASQVRDLSPVDPSLKATQCVGTKFAGGETICWMHLTLRKVRHNFNISSRILTTARRAFYRNRASKYVAIRGAMFSVTRRLE
jgi:hypothetical protein